MTYNEWRDELKDNLLCVSEAERRRVLDYYAEAYADRRDAGYSEREIIQDFGAPYDAAQRILSENGGGYRNYDDYDEPRRYIDDRERRREEREREREERERRRREERDRKRADEERRRREERDRKRADEERRREDEERRRREERDRNDYDYYQNSQPYSEPAKTEKAHDNYTWVFVLLCIIFCVPLFGLIMGMVGISIGLCVAPFAILVSGAVQIGAGVGAMFVNVLDGLCELGVGLIIFGIGVALISLFPRLVKLMWKVFGKVFGWIKSLFSGKECV